MDGASTGWDGTWKSKGVESTSKAYSHISTRSVGKQLCYKPKVL